MCGICGFIEPGGFVEQRAEAQLRAMTDRIRHRGPDGQGVWLDGAQGVALGHRRLAIIDPSPTGAQPMSSPSGRYQIVFNGEIYNHMELRGRIDDGVQWRGHSDTESLLAAFEAFGIAETLRMAVGMFSIAVWDTSKLRLTLARDRLGEKPLYYGWQAGTLLFGSELKALEDHRAFEGRTDQSALAAYLQVGYIPAPASIYEGIYKLPPGSTWSYSAKEPAGSLPAPEPYWSLTGALEKGSANPFTGSAEEAVDELERLLSQSVAGQLMADVPLGAFLSGGIDSSTIVALMQSLVGRPVNTFTIGFSEASHDESMAARAVAGHLGTHHTELILTPEDALAVVPNLGGIYDEPFGDSSAIPTWLVSRLAAESVKVALSGDGGDELFAGYNRYERTARVWEAVQGVPPFMRRGLGTGLGALLGRTDGRRLLRGRPATSQRLSKSLGNLQSTLGAASFDEFYELRQRNWFDVSGLLQSRAQPTAPWGRTQANNREGALERMMANDTRSYLPDDVMVKVDRASMSHSLEARAPLLDHRIVEFAWSLPTTHKVREGHTKWVLRNLLYRHVPRELVDRPKQGFGVPIDTWLRGPLREWAESHLSVQALEQSGPFVAAPIRSLWIEHLAGADWQYELWPILAYQAWARSGN